MEAAGLAQAEAGHVHLVLHGAQQVAQQPLQLPCIAAHGLGRACQELRWRHRRQQFPRGGRQGQVHAALVPLILALLDQALGFQGLQRLRHRSLGQPQVFGHRQRRVRVVVAPRQVLQRTELHRLQVGQQRVLPVPDAHQAGQAFEQVEELGHGHLRR
ncbi:hypothetical protein D3C78_1516220 [compost metagenome]